MGNLRHLTSHRPRWTYGGFGEVDGVDGVDSGGGTGALATGQLASGRPLEALSISPTG